MEQQPSIWIGIKGALIYGAFVLSLNGCAIWLYPRIGQIEMWIAKLEW
jgi:hypothetical protein